MLLLLHHCIRYPTRNIHIQCWVINWQLGKALLTFFYFSCISLHYSILSDVILEKTLTIQQLYYQTFSISFMGHVDYLYSNPKGTRIRLISSQSLENVPFNLCFFSSFEGITKLRYIIRQVHYDLHLHMVFHQYPQLACQGKHYFQTFQLVQHLSNV